MIPQDEFTPFGYLDNPYHSWKLNPSGVLRSKEPLAMGWHMPNFGSYARNQFQYSAHLAPGLKIGKMVLITPGDFKRHKCQIFSRLHTKNRFEYTCIVPTIHLTLTARYFLINEHALGCIITLAAPSAQQLPVTLYLMHQHIHNPHTSRLWEHGIYTMTGPHPGTCLLGIASEGDAFLHGARSADGGPLTFDTMHTVIAPEDAAMLAHSIPVAEPSVTEYEESTGWQARTVVQPCHLILDGAPRTINAVLTRGISQDQVIERWNDSIEEIARAEAEHREDDERFWNRAPRLEGDWPDHWRRGLVYDLETLRMVIRPSVGVLTHFFDGMQIQAPRAVLAEAGIDTLLLSYADPELAAEVLLCHFEEAPRPNLPCMREDGSYNMVADDGQICGTAPEWGFPLWCIDQQFRRSGDLFWLHRLYPRVAAYLRWWLEHRRDRDGWLVYACSWESGQDVSSRFGTQQTGGTIIEHVRPSDLQASMAQGAAILADWAAQLARAENLPPLPDLPPIDYQTETKVWQQVANEFRKKTLQMWHDGWFRDYDSGTGEHSNQQDTMHLAPVFCGVATPEQLEQLRPAIQKPPYHSGWHTLSWPPVTLTLVGAALAAHMPEEATRIASTFIDASWRSTDRRTLDEHKGLPGITREYLRTIEVGKWGEIDYVNAGIEGYGWGALSIYLFMHVLLGLQERRAGQLHVAPMLPQDLRTIGARYRVRTIQWGKHTLSLELHVQEKERYTCRLEASRDEAVHPELGLDPQRVSQHWEWSAAWGEGQTLTLP